MAPVPAMSTSLTTPAALVNTPGAVTWVQLARPAAGRWNSPPVVATSTSAGLSGSMAIFVQPSPARLVASRVHDPSTPPEVDTRTPMPNSPRNPARCSPVPTYTWSAARSAPNDTASAPTDSEFACRAGTGAAGVVRKSSSASQVSPPSGENQAPPSAAPT